MHNLTHAQILAELPKAYRDLVDKATAEGNDLDRAIIGALAILSIRNPKLFKQIQNKLERKQPKSPV